MNKKLLVILLVFVAAAGAYFSMTLVVFPSPGNCKICHFIAPFYDKWETSTHNTVPCLKCHEYSPATALAGQFKFLAGAYNPRPLTNVPDKNCLQSTCHDKRLVESKVMFTKRGIDFDHKPHFSKMQRGIQLHCRSCHSDIVQGEHVKVSMNVCFLCHFKGVPHDGAFTGCPSCHSYPKQPVEVGNKTFSHEEVLKAGYTCNQCHIEVTKGDGTAPKEKCYFCHVNRTEKYNDIDFVHEKHVTEKQVDCLWCHPRIEHGIIRMVEKMPTL